MLVVEGVEEEDEGGDEGGGEGEDGEADASVKEIENRKRLRIVKPHFWGEDVLLDGEDGPEQEEER